MAGQYRVDGAPSPTYVGDVTPLNPACNSTWCDTSSVPYQLKVFDCRTNTWVFCGYYTTLGQEGIAGYAAGGYSGGNSSLIDKLLFATESISSLLTGLATARGMTVGISSSTSGYASGGYHDLTTIDKLFFSTEVSSTLASGRTNEGFDSSGLKATVVGYSVGGQTSGSYTIYYWDRITFSTDSVAPITSTYDVEAASGVQNSSNGYLIGGGSNYSGSEIWYSTTQKLTFSSEAISQLLSVIPVTRVFMQCGLSSNVSGYAVGGAHWHLPSVKYTNIDKLLFASESISVNASSLATAKGTMAGSSSRLSGYIMGGSTASGNTSSVDRLYFQADVVSSLASTLSLARNGPAGLENLN